MGIGVVAVGHRSSSELVATGGERRCQSLSSIAKQATQTAPDILRRGQTGEILGPFWARGKIPIPEKSIGATGFEPAT
jgi:hypothetical protein